MMVAGWNEGARDRAAALGQGSGLVGVCAQERVTRVRGGGSTSASGPPDEALDLLLSRMGRTRADIWHYVLAENGPSRSTPADGERIGHHFAHASTAYLTSPFSSAAIVVCDHEAPAVSVWKGDGASIRPVEWPWPGTGFSAAFSRIASLLAFRSQAADQRFEALARLEVDRFDEAIDPLIRLDAGGIWFDPAFDRAIEDRLAGDRDPGSTRRAALASAMQARLGQLLLSFLGRVREAVGDDRLCVGGSLFYHSSMNTLIKRAGLFADVFVPIDPGNSGLAAGAALHALGRSPVQASPFLGPSYTVHETKAVLDNCKLNYSWESEEECIGIAVEALVQGRLVGWFDGAMEWGPRALGGRCILASPTAPYVLENLNHFLKHREKWRGYALSGTEAAVHEHFDGPLRAPFMECDYRPKDPERFRHFLPSPGAAVRVHTVSEGGPPLFTRLLEAMGEATGLPLVVNTSFNGFHEPIVCSPRDAVRVFYGSGLDLLVLNQFVLRK